MLELQTGQGELVAGAFVLGGAGDALVEGALSALHGPGGGFGPHVEQVHPLSVLEVELAGGEALALELRAQGLEPGALLLQAARQLRAFDGRQQLSPGDLLAWLDGEPDEAGRGAEESRVVSGDDAALHRDVALEVAANHRRQAHPRGVDRAVGARPAADGGVGEEGAGEERRGNEPRTATLPGSGRGRDRAVDAVGSLDHGITEQQVVCQICRVGPKD